VRRSLRIFLTTATVLSAVLCVTTLALWVRSYWQYDFGSLTRDYGPGPHPERAQGVRRQWTCMVNVLNGRVAILLAPEMEDAPGDMWRTSKIAGNGRLSATRLDERLAHHAIGFGYERYIPRQPVPGWNDPPTRQLIVPRWRSRRSPLSG
jgi:hypothetical protein